MQSIILSRHAYVTVVSEGSYQRRLAVTPVPVTVSEPFGTVDYYIVRRLSDLLCRVADAVEQNDASDITEAATRGVRVAIAPILAGKVSVRRAGRWIVGFRRKLIARKVSNWTFLVFSGSRKTRTGSCSHTGEPSSQGKARLHAHGLLAVLVSVLACVKGVAWVDWKSCRCVEYSTGCHFRPSCKPRANVRKANLNLGYGV